MGPYSKKPPPKKIEIEKYDRPIDSLQDETKRSNSTTTEFPTSCLTSIYAARRAEFINQIVMGPLPLALTDWYYCFEVLVGLPRNLETLAKGVTSPRKAIHNHFVSYILSYIPLRYDTVPNNTLLGLSHVYRPCGIMLRPYQHNITVCLTRRTRCSAPYSVPCTAYI